MSKLDLIAFDADDTLWHNLIHFDDAQKQFGMLLSNFTSQAEAVATLEASPAPGRTALAIVLESRRLGEASTGFRNTSQ